MYELPLLGSITKLIAFFKCNDKKYTFAHCAMRISSQNIVETLILQRFMTMHFRLRSPRGKSGRELGGRKSKAPATENSKVDSLVGFNFRDIYRRKKFDYGNLILASVKTNTG